MAGEQHILREYLISLGFKVDGKGEKQLGENLSKWDKQATRLARSIFGVAAAAQVMVTEFAFRMERLFYSSKLAESAASNLQALDFGAQQVGVKDFTELVMNLARAVRGNPGLQGLLHSLGVQTEGRDKADVLKDLVKTLTSMPHYIGQRYAALFGIDPDQLLLLKEGMADMERFAAARAQMAKDLGVDVDQAAVAGKEYAQQWREILSTIGLARDALSLAMLPVMRDMAGVAKEVLGDWIRIIQESDRAKNAPPPGSITAKGAAQSGLTEDEQIEMAMRAPKVKTWSEMSPDERFAAGMGVDAPRRKDYDKLTPDEREKYGIKERPWWMKLLDYAARLDFGLGALVVNTMNREGVEFSTQTKERLGYDRTRGTPGADANPFARLKDSALDALSYRSIPKSPMDAASVEAATAPDPSVLQAQAPAPARGDAAAILAELERQKGLRAGVLDYIWKTESGRGSGGNIYGPVTKTGERAEGPFQFMKGTADQYGLKDTQSFPDSAKAAASYMHDLVEKYGDMRFALAAYNWGQSNLDKLMDRTMRQHPTFSQSESDRYVLGHLPEETRKYVNGYAGAAGADGSGQSVTINAPTKIDVHETHSAEATARMIADNQSQLWGDLTRQFSGKVK